MSLASPSAKPDFGLLHPPTPRGTCVFGNEEQFHIKMSLTRPLSNPSSAWKIHIPISARSRSPFLDPTTTTFTQVQRRVPIWQLGRGAREDGGGEIREVKGKGGLRLRWCLLFHTPPPRSLTRARPPIKGLFTLLRESRHPPPAVGQLEPLLLF